MILKYVFIAFVVCIGITAIPGSYQAVAAGVFVGLYAYGIFKEDFLDKR